MRKNSEKLQLFEDWGGQVGVCKDFVEREGCKHSEKASKNNCSQRVSLSTQRINSWFWISFLISQGLRLWFRVIVNHIWKLVIATEWNQNFHIIAHVLWIDLAEQSHSSQKATQASSGCPCFQAEIRYQQQHSTPDLNIMNNRYLVNNC